MKEDKDVRIGILDIHGSVEEHTDLCTRLGVQATMVKKPEHLLSLDGLIIPGGESTVMAKLMQEYGIDVAIKREVERGICVYGTCAGAILLSRHIEEESRFEPLGLINISVRRNGYGRQLDSFETTVSFQGFDVPAVFIRAPQITEVGDDVHCISEQEGIMIAAENKQILVTTFHPELTHDTTVHRYFIQKCIQKNP